MQKSRVGFLYVVFIIFAVIVAVVIVIIIVTVINSFGAVIIVVEKKTAKICDLGRNIQNQRAFKLIVLTRQGRGR